jgi:hypothetical protein
MDKINIKVNEWSEMLAKRIVDIRFIDLDEMKVAIAVHIKNALYDCLKEQIPETERRLNQLKIRLAGGGNTLPLQAEIVAMKQKRKEEYEVYSNLDRENMGREMAIWMRKYHNESVEDFYKYYNEKYPKLNVR